MTIEISGGDQLEHLIKRVAAEVQEAHGLHRLLRELHEALATSDPRYFNFPTYWTFCLLGLRDAYLLRLSRVFDQERRSLSLRNLLLTIRENTDLFETDEFKARLADNEFVDSLASEVRVPSKERIDADLAYVGTRNPIVKRLVRWRNTSGAHLGAKAVLGKDAVLKEDPFTAEDVERLLDGARKILNHYSQLFSATTYSMQFIGNDDHESLLRFLGAGLEADEQSKG